MSAPRPADPDPLRYALSEARSDAFFAEVIAPAYLSPGRPAADGDRPQVLLLAGQTGAGKSRTREALTDDASWSGAVEIGSDIFRAHHPAYRDLLRDDPVSAAFYTDHDARRWVDRALAYAAEHRLSVIFDSTLSRPTTAETITERFRSAGYHLHAAFVAAAAPVSRLSVIDRYQTALLNDLPGRYSLNHDETYQGVRQVAVLLDQRVLVDQVSVYRRGGTLLHTNQALVTAGDDPADPTSPGRWRYSPGLARELDAERDRPWSATEGAHFLDDVQRVARQAATLTQGPSWYRRIADAAQAGAAHITTREQQQQLISLVAQMRLRAAGSDPSRVAQLRPSPRNAPKPPAPGLPRGPSGPEQPRRPGGAR